MRIATLTFTSPTGDAASPDCGICDTAEETASIYCFELALLVEWRACGVGSGLVREILDRRA
jgi:hypothetical protein